MIFPDWLQRRLACPRDGLPVRVGEDEVLCAAGHVYPRIQGVPVMLVDELPPNHPAISRTFEYVRGAGHPAEGPTSDSTGSGPVDWFVQREIVASNGQLYRRLVERLPRYPIPRMRLPHGDNRVLLDVGCNWGRWSVAASKKRYAVVGIDPSLDAILAALRVADQLSINAVYMVADVRALPFANETFDVVFSYSVLQHFSAEDAAAAMTEMSRVLRNPGSCLVQLANSYGMRSLWNQARRGFKEPKNFEVRYWPPSQMRRVAEGAIGRSTLLADGYFSLNPQSADLDLLPLHFRLLVRFSAILCALSRRLPWLVRFADSVYVASTKSGGRGETSAP